MTDKMKSCFTPHVMMHALFGLGLGLVIAHFWANLADNVWIGVGAMVVAVVLDMMRKD